MCRGFAKHTLRDCFLLMVSVMTALVVQGYMPERQGDTWCCRNTGQGGRETSGVAETHDMEAGGHLVLQEHRTGRQGDTWCFRDTGQGGRETHGASGIQDMEAGRHMVLHGHRTWRQGDTWCCSNSLKTRVMPVSAGGHIVLQGHMTGRWGDTLCFRKTTCAGQNLFWGIFCN